jgi:hypothetical protein
MYKVIIWGSLVAMSTGAQYVPSGVHLNRSSRSIEDSEWERVKHGRDIHSLESFISRFPRGRHLKAAERLLGMLAEGERSRSAEDTRAYKLVPEGKHVVRAVPVDNQRK